MDGETIVRWDFTTKRLGDAKERVMPRSLERLGFNICQRDFWDKLRCISKSLTSHLYSWEDNPCFVKLLWGLNETAFGRQPAQTCFLKILILCCCWCCVHFLYMLGSGLYLISSPIIFLTKWVYPNYHCSHNTHRWLGKGDVPWE